MILSGPGSGVAVVMSVQEFKTQRKTKVRTRKQFISFYFDLIVSGPGESYSLYCTTILSGAQTKFEHQCDVITFQPYAYKSRRPTAGQQEHMSGLLGGQIPVHRRHSGCDRQSGRDGRSLSGTMALQKVTVEKSTRV